MPSNPNQYENPLISRYASAAMSELWSPQRKFSTWRRLWVALAEAEAELGLPITPRQIAQLREHVDNIDFEAAARYERRLRHDVMAHVHAYGDVCPEARPIIHLGATSCYVTDNTDLLLLRESLELVRERAGGRDRLAWPPSPGSIATCPAWPIPICSRRSRPRWASGPASGPTTWCWTWPRSTIASAQLKAQGSKGTTGTQASFLSLFQGDHAKVRRLEELICRKMGFAESYPVTGQTYSRKIDSQVMGVLSGIAQSAHKMATDLRLLANRKEIEEPFETEQIGSSAMAYKRNPCAASGSVRWPGSS